MAATPALQELTDGAADGRRCGICQTAIAAGEAVGGCPECQSPYHRECWAEHGGCATYGCTLLPETVKDPGPAAPVTFWGQEEKQCPACGQRIKIAALRCRFCGQLFAERAPDGQLARIRGAPPPKRAAVVLFVGGLFPPTAPFVLLGGGLWLLAHRNDVARLPAAHRVMALLGVLAAGLATGALLLAAVAHRLLG
jgi:hypothetical protein